MPLEKSSIEQDRIARHKTALRRYALSRPLSLALASGVVSKSTSVFDYGCGRGSDVRFLQKAGISANGWDPHFKPDEQIKTADCVNLGYVLNVIENLSERSDTLRRAYELARNVLIVSVRVDTALGESEGFSDGVLTRAGTFQKLFTQDEFREYLRSNLGRTPHMASLGVAYVFKTEKAEAKYLAEVSILRPKLIQPSVLTQFANDRIARKYIELTMKLGRPPVPSEFKSLEKLVERFGPVARIERITLRALEPYTLASIRENRRESLLTYLAMMQIQGMKLPPVRLLPDDVQADMKMFWPRYEAANDAGREFLFQLGKPGFVRAACSNAPVGKRLPEDFYLHKSGESQLPAHLVLLLFAARQVVGEVDYDLIKIALDGRKVSFLKYREFESIAHPELLYSVRVYLPTASFSIRDYSKSANPPVLHRKDSLVDSLHPRYEEFAALTVQEEKLGLLSRIDIGTRERWNAILAEHGVRIIDHSLIPNNSGEPDSIQAG